MLWREPSLAKVGRSPNRVNVKEFKVFGFRPNKHHPSAKLFHLPSCLTTNRKLTLSEIRVLNDRSSVKSTSNLLFPVPLLTPPNRKFLALGEADGARSKKTVGTENPFNTCITRIPPFSGRALHPVDPRISAFGRFFAPPYIIFIFIKVPGSRSKI